MSTETRSPSADAAEFHIDTRDTALARVDRLLGNSTEWPSGVIEFRLTDDSQVSWKEEVGHWLGTAERHQFLSQVLADIKAGAKRGTKSKGIDPNDERHNKLAQALAPAEVVHYLVHTGWCFEAWEPIVGGSEDVDLSLTRPDGPRTYFQVKASDVPGWVENGRRVRGEFDSRVITAIQNAAEQLPRKGPEARVIAMCANRVFPISSFVGNLVSELIGEATRRGSVVTLSRRGAFWNPEWRHVSGLVLLDFVCFVDIRADGPVDVPRYLSTVLLNPHADVVARAEWFPRARVLELVGDEFQWTRGVPTGTHVLPSGTKVVEQT